MSNSEYPLRYKTCDASVSAMQAQIEAFDEIYANICGRADNYNAVVNTTAGNFSELIADDLLGVAEENRTAWNCALSASFHAVGVLNLYVTAVEHYEDRIETLESELDTEIAAAETDKEKQELSDEYKDLADGEWETLKGVAGQASDMLSEGPTPENVRTLTENGYLGDVPGGLGWVVTGNDIYFSLPEGMSGREFSEAAREAAEGAPDPTGERARNAALLAAFMASLALRGDVMTDREREVLEEFNGSLEGSGGKPSGIHGNYVNIMRQISENNFLSYGEKRDLMNALGTSIMVTSDESKGGGFSDLPQSVRHLISGPEIYGPGTGGWGSNWEEDFGILTRYLEFASESHMERTATENGPGEPLVGGDVFSATAIGTVAANLDGADDEDVMARMLEIASQNKDANYAVITGSYPSGESYDHPAYFNYGPGRSGTDNVELLEELFGYDWTCDAEPECGGAECSNKNCNSTAPRSLTDWIYEDNVGGNEEESRRAGEAAHALLTNLAGEDGEDNGFRDTGEEHGDNPNAAVTEINPELAESLASIYISYLDDFSIVTDGDGYGELYGESSRFLFHEQGDEALMLPPEIRQRFLQLLVANEDLAPNLIVATEAQERRIIEQILNNPELEARLGGNESALLRSTLDNALIDEYVDRGLDNEKALEKANQAWQTGYNVFTAAASGGLGGRATVPGMTAEILLKLAEQPLKDMAAEEFEGGLENDYLNELEHSLLENSAEARRHAHLQVVGAMVSSEVIPFEKLEEHNLLVEGPGGDMVLPMTMAEWGDSPDLFVSRSLELFEEVDDPRLEAYADAFVESFGLDLHEERLDAGWPL